MPSLTPAERSQEATNAALYDGLISGGLTLIPSTAVVYTAMKNPAFRKATNWQSRTGLTIMPPLFMYAIASEMKLNHKMKEMASESEHHKKVSHWAENKHARGVDMNVNAALISTNSTTELTRSIQKKTADIGVEKRLHEIYKKSVEDSGIRIVPGDSLGVHHKIANFWQENPFKILAAVSLPTVLYIFRGRNDQKHLQMQSKLMHTRVYGQFTVLGMLLAFMSFKNYMDSSGKFITQEEADFRVSEMKRMRADLLERIDFDKKMKARREGILSKTQVDVQKDLRIGSNSTKKLNGIAIEDA